MHTNTTHYLKYDTNNLKELGGNDPEFTQRMLQTFIASASKTGAEIEDALQRKDNHNLRVLLHRLSANFAYVNAEAIRKDTLKLEAAVNPDTNLEPFIKPIGNIIDSLYALCAKIKIDNNLS